MNSCVIKWVAVGEHILVLFESNNPESLLIDRTVVRDDVNNTTREASHAIKRYPWLMGSPWVIVGFD